MTAEDGRTSCRGCMHFFVTHDRQRPWGCRKFGFKGKSLPALVVFQSTGMHCAYYQQNPSLDQNKPKKTRDGKGNLDIKG